MSTSPERLLTQPDLLSSRWSCTPRPGTSLDDVLGAVGDRSFATSGSRTGVPSVRWRTSAQLAREAAMTIAALPGSIDRIVTTVAPTSLYGYALGVLTPLALAVPVRHQPLLLGDLGLAPGHTLVVTVAPGWCTGPALPPVPFGCEVTFVHAGSMLPPRARTLVDACPGSRLVELFGATETGLLATRAHLPFSGTDRDPWTVVEDVDLVVAPVVGGGEVPLAVRSPRLASTERHGIPPERIVLGDWIAPVDARRFGFLGRRERLVKPGGLAVDLDLLEARIGALTGFRLGLVCVPVLDPVGGEMVVLEVEGGDALARQVEAVLRADAGLPVRPRVVAVDRIDRSPMGKPRPMRLAA